MAHLNVELKARCAHPDGIVQRLLELGAQSQGTDVQTDVYYRVAKGRLKRRHGEIENNLIHYERPDEHAPKESQVSMVTVGSEGALDDVLDAALERDVVVTKQRHRRPRSPLLQRPAGHRHVTVTTQGNPAARPQADPSTGPRATRRATWRWASSCSHWPRRRSCRRVVWDQWWPARPPLSRSCMRALGMFRPTISTVLPRCSYFVLIASSAATVEASQMCASDRSMTTCSGSPA